MAKKQQKIILRGIPANPGQIQGRVRIIRSFKKFPKLNKKEIVVASFLTPEAIILMKRYSQVSGIITDKGGATSHIAVLARELGIPYIAGTEVATKKLKDNILISMDCSKGIIYETS